MPANDDQPPKPPRAPPLQGGEVLGEEEPEEEERPRGRKRKRTKRKASEEELEEEVSEATALAEILSKGERSTELIHVQTDANAKTIRSQANFIYALKGVINDREGRIKDLEAALTASQNAWLELVGKLGDVTLQKAQAEAAAAGGSKVKEVIDVASAILQTDLGQAVSRIATSHLGKLEAKDEKGKTKALEAKPEKKEIEE